MKNMHKENKRSNWFKSLFIPKITIYKIIYISSNVTLGCFNNKDQCYNYVYTYIATLHKEHYLQWIQSQKLANNMNSIKQYVNILYLEEFKNYRCEKIKVPISNMAAFLRIIYHSIPLLDFQMGWEYDCWTNYLVMSQAKDIVDEWAKNSVKDTSNDAISTK